MEPMEEAKQSETQMKTEETGRFSSALFDWAESLVIAILLVIALFTFICRIVIVDGHSMESTLHHGQLMLVSAIGYEEERGDIIVLHNDFHGPIVKRIVATEGDTVDIDFDNAQVYLNGEALDEPYLDHFSYYDYEGIDFPQTVPEDCVFVLGDNRNGSTDSRSPLVGMVDQKSVIGKVYFTIFPLDSFGMVD